MQPFKKGEILAASRLNEMVRLINGGNSPRNKKQHGFSQLYVCKIISSELIEVASTATDSETTEYHYEYKLRILDKTKDNYTIEEKGWTAISDDQDVKGYNINEEYSYPVKIENDTIVYAIPVEVSSPPPASSGAKHFELWFSHLPEESFWARITGQDSANFGHYSFIKVGHEDGEFLENKDVSSEIDDVEMYLALETHINPYVISGSIVRMFIKGRQSESENPDVMWYNFSYVPFGVPFIVTVAEDGGVAGDATTNCSFTYSVSGYLSGDTPHHTAITPLAARQEKIAYTAGTVGQAIILSPETPNTIPQIKLLQVFDEVPTTNICEPV